MKQFLPCAFIAAILVSGCAKPIVPCRNKLFKSPNTTKSLMEWSVDAHVEAKKTAQSDPAAHKKACEKALKYRASAHCKAPFDPNIKKKLQETAALCRPQADEMGISKDSGAVEEQPATQEKQDAPEEKKSEASAEQDGAAGGQNKPESAEKKDGSYSLIN